MKKRSTKLLSIWLRSLRRDSASFVGWAALGQPAKTRGARSTRLRARAVALALLAASPALAEAPPDNAQAQAAAAELAQVAGATATLSKLLDVMRSALIKILVQSGHATEEKATSTCDEVLMPPMKAHVGDITHAITEIWARNFTVDELHGLLAFYKTPLGQKLLEKQPIVAREAFAAGRELGERIAREAIQQHIQELRQRGITL